ncbi:MAG: hypothetical protein JWN56_2611 [Sphingobacteriales bacterium]|nr:hypothetical protein [Sphingobacteriales bacterium]
MNRRHISLYTVIATLLVALSLGSCKKESPDPGGTAVQAVAGEWWVQVRDADGNFTPDFAEDYYHFATYNTAANSPTEIWIDDLESFWAIKGKINVNVSALTFSSSAPIGNVYYESQFTVANGKIINSVSKGPVSKAVTDSIYFETTLSDFEDADGNVLPDKVFKLSGYRRTRFSEDDH